MEGKWKDYFTFTKKERIGIYTLLLLIVGCTMLPQFFTSPSLNRELTAAAIQLEKAPVQPEQEFARRSNYERRPGSNSNVTLFRFDPNTLDEAGWKKLGLPERTVRTILNYRNKGGKFRTVADLQKMYS